MLTLALSTAEKYVAAAYMAFLVLVLVYLAIMATKLSRLEREVVAVADIVEGVPAREGERPPAPPPKAEAVT